MSILILIDPATGGGYRATAGDPFGISAEADSAEAAAQRLEAILRGRLEGGSRLATLDLGVRPGRSPSPLRLEALPVDDWFFQTMRDAINEERKREDEATE